MDYEEWYNQLALVKAQLSIVDPTLITVFKTVDDAGFKLHAVIKDPYVALIGAIIGQKITYELAKDLRSKLYQQLGTTFTPQQLVQSDLSFLSVRTRTIILDVTRYIVTNNVDLSTVEGIRSLQRVSGIGPWTIDTTLLTSLKDWDVFPLGDKFLQARMKKLYGSNCNMAAVSDRWSPYKSIVTWYLWRWF